MINIKIAHLRFLLRVLTGCSLTAILLTQSILPAQAQFDPQPAIEDHGERASNAMQLGNYAVAYCIWQPMADNGDANAQFNIGWMYHNGYGLRIDDEMALYWWLRAATTGDANAHFALGDLFAAGQGVDKSMEIALGWYISAANKDHEQARETLIELLKNDSSYFQHLLQILLQTEWQLLGNPMEIKVERANIRSGPNKNHKIISTLEKGHPVIPLHKENGWTQIGITTSGKTGWVFSGLLTQPAGIYPAE